MVMDTTRLRRLNNHMSFYLLLTPHQVDFGGGESLLPFRSPQLVIPPSSWLYPAQIYYIRYMIPKLTGLVVRTILVEYYASFLDLHKNKRKKRAYRTVYNTHSHIQVGEFIKTGRTCNINNVFGKLLKIRWNY